MCAALTVGFGTHERPASLEATLERLLTVGDPVIDEIVVVDDASADATHDVLNRAVNRASGAIRVVRHTARVGFGGALATLIEQTRTPWLLLTSDDDVLLPGLTGLMEELRLRRPAILVPGFIDGDRGDIRSKPTGTVVRPVKVWGTLGHAPGIVFDVAVARPHVEPLRALISAGDPFATVYPQVVLGVNIACAGGAIVHWSEPIAATGDDNPSGIRDPNGEPYWAMGARMRQFFAYQTYLERRIAETTEAEQECFRKVLEWNRIKLLDFFAAWLTVDHPGEAASVNAARVRTIHRWHRIPAALRVLQSGRP